MMFNWLINKIRSWFFEKCPECGSTYTKAPYGWECATCKHCGETFNTGFAGKRGSQLNKGES